MSRRNGFGKVIGGLIGLVAYTLKTLLKAMTFYAPRIIKALIERINKQLRFSITFKTVTNYTFMLAAILFSFSILVGVAFGGLLFYETTQDLHRIVTVTEEMLFESSSIPKAQFERYAEIEGVTITLIGPDNKVKYSTGEVDTIPVEVLNNDGETVVNEKIFFRKATLASEAFKYTVVERFILKEVFYVLLLMSALFICSIIAILISMRKGSKNLKRMLKPIDDMILTARTMSASNLDRRLNVVDSHDELKDLAETFNGMLDRIEEAYEQQDRFVSDASHELRTPISVIQGYANLLGRWGKEDREVLDESVNAIKNEAESMKNLVERLLFLARADKERQKLNFTRFSLDELINEVVRDTRVIDDRHNIYLKINDEINFNGDRDLIKQVLRIFLDNSIKYTPPQGSLSISSYLENKNICITIEDTGIGIAPEDLPHVFNRFYKCDKSRSRESGGTGLGLAIAKWIIERHKGLVTLESQLDKGTKVKIIFRTAM